MYQGILRDFNVFVDGVGYVGRAASYKPPTLSTTTTSHRGAGMDVSVPIDMGMEDLEASITFSGFEVEAMKQWGKISGDTTITVRGGLIKQGSETVTKVVHEITGKIVETDLGEWQPGEAAEHSLTLRAHYFRVEHDGKKITEIDALNQVRFTNGADQLKSLRDATGR